ncbi:MAG TPA: acyl-CoA thioesterase [Vicinamibacterales bacterium]|nr:acyl-CoA thioesterase [Vicinamibacterales bacterium]
MPPIREFTYHRRVQYKETDASGIVHFSSFFVYAEEAEHAMWRAAGLSVEPLATAIGWPRVSAAFDFFKPLRFEDEIEVRIRLVERTAKTFRYQSVIMLDGEVAAMGSSTSICARKAPNEPLAAMDIPHAIADCFEVLPAVERPRRASSGPPHGNARAVGERIGRMQDDGFSG